MELCLCFQRQLMLIYQRFLVPPTFLLHVHTFIGLVDLVEKLLCLSFQLRVPVFVWMIEHTKPAVR